MKFKGFTYKGEGTYEVVLELENGEEKAFALKLELPIELMGALIHPDREFETLIWDDTIPGDLTREIFQAVGAHFRTLDI